MIWPYSIMPIMLFIDVLSKRTNKEQQNIAFCAKFKLKCRMNYNQTNRREDTMPNLSTKNAQVINDFITNYKQLNVVGKKLFPQAIKDLLAQHPSSEAPAQNAFQLINTLIETTKLIKFSCIIQFTESTLYKNCKLLKAKGLFSEENALALLSHPEPKRLFAAIRLLNEQKMLHGNAGQEHFAAVAQHMSIPDKVAHALITLHKATLLNAKNRDAVIQHPTHPEAIAALIQLITPWSLLTGEQGENNFKQMINHPHPDSLLQAVELLDPSDSELQDKFEVIMHSQASYAVALSLLELDRENMPISAIKSSLIEAAQPGVVTTQLINKKNALQNSIHQASSSTAPDENVAHTQYRM
ncbi:MAG: hypothetical protein P4L79_06720 [Legionella sp.]|uniref:hypothetical protein n=1 Tax=Legionella sp. TaxID=459 RepID=UPI002842ADE2|nr:hypothetical protein [Legionella sp.]